MEDWIQYHNPRVMGFGVEMCNGPPYSILTSVAHGNPIGNRVWLIGKMGDGSDNVWVAYCFTVDNVVASTDRRFLYKYIGQTGTNFDPMPIISGETWFGKLRAATGNFNLGFSKITRREIVKGLHAVCEAEGYQIQ